MAVITVGGSPYPEAIRGELEKPAAERPGRDFWHMPCYVGPSAWSSRPRGEAAADIIRYSPEAVRAALLASGDAGQ